MHWPCCCWTAAKWPRRKPLLQRAIAAAPDEPSLHNNLGNLLYRSDDMTGAAQAYAKAVALKPDYAKPITIWAPPSACWSGEDEALDAYRKALALTPSLWSAHVQIAALLHRKGDNDEALKMLDAAMPAAAAVVRDLVLSRHHPACAGAP